MTPPLLNIDNARVFHKIIEAMSAASLGVHMSGERGLGKETIVRLLYARSPHCGTPFIKVNCPMLSGTDGPDNTPCLSQATSRHDISSISLFRLFCQGVLYLHAVDEMDMDLQGRLVALINRKLRSSPFCLNGSKKGMLIFSTSTRPLEACVASGTLDAALYEVLSGLSIHIPPLRDSLSRIGPLVDYFLNRFAVREGHNGCPHLSASQLSVLRHHRWPGNVKELQEIVKTALRRNNWDAAIGMLNCRGTRVDSFATVDLSPDGVTLMPDFEIRQACMLERLAEKIPSEQLGLMDLVFYEEAMSPNKIN